MPLVKRTLASAQTNGADKAATIDALLAELQSPYPQQRRGAARRLGEHPEAAAALCFALETEVQESVREALFTALIRIGEPGAEGLLPLLGSDDAALRNGAIEALKTMPAAMAAHVEEILAGPADVRIFGVEILGALANPQSIRRLARVLAEDGEINVCAAAVDALLDCGDATLVEPLQTLLERFPDEPFLTFAVRTALARIASG